MTLHEAIYKLLTEKNRWMSTQEIANELNTNKWYSKKDGSLITAFQIHGRTKNYKDLFERNGALVGVKGKANQIVVSAPKSSSGRNLTPINNSSLDIHLVEKVLMNENNFKPANKIEELVPNRPGVYCIRIKEVSLLSEPFRKILNERGHNIIYIGIASQNLRTRFFNQELNAIGHGTFFRSLGAVLGYKPPVGSLLGKRNKRNYKFSNSDECQIIDWIKNNIIVNWQEYDKELDEFESELIVKYLPLLNLAKNPAASDKLKALRAECVSIANTINK
ncbi:GIY-YIG nuclease family protein [Mangrovibacterium lignilyticum]|uniref:GIY-YIG nuclease family protein n=1 Tax=Mangrovibacterium lignilyticum TaxID=2668052 RepID=UPI0019674F33|nr:hypothetical protein [Mangrovibacterium lignilyticum]